MGSALGAAGDLGIRDDFKSQARDLVQPGTSAIFVVLRKATPDKFLDGMRPYGGTVLRTSLAPDAEVRLMKALHGDDQAATTPQQRTPSAHGAHASGAYGMTQSAGTATGETPSSGRSWRDPGRGG